MVNMCYRKVQTVLNIMSKKLQKEQEIPNMENQRNC